MKRLLMVLCVLSLVFGTASAASAILWSDYVFDYDDQENSIGFNPLYNGGRDYDGDGLVDFGDAQYLNGRVSPIWALGAPDETYVSILPGESITFGFSDPFINGPGYDLVIVETGHANEKAYVEVSSDGTSFTLLGIVDVGGLGPNSTPYGDYYWFDLGLISDPISYIRISDSVLGSTPGFDISGVGASSSVPEPTTMLLLSSGLIGLAGFRRKFKK